MLTNTGRLRGRIRGGASGTSDYPSLKDKPQINGVTLEGNQTPEDLQMKLSQLANDAGYAKSSIVAPEYSEEATYDVGDYVTYENTLYKCNSKITTAEEWNPEHWTAVNVAEIVPTKTSDLNNDSGYTSSTVIAEAYDETSTYAVGAYVTHDNNLYKCNTAITTAEEWNAEHWTLVDVISAIPTKTSELDNDSGFITGDNYYDKTEIDTITNSLTEFPSDLYWSENALKGKLYRTFEGIITNFDVSSLKGENGKTYYIKPNGNDSNSGLDREHPLQKLSTAIAKADVETVIVMDGVYNIGRIGGAFTKGLKLLADENAHPIFIMSRDKTWTKSGGYTNVYQTTDSASVFYGVVNLNEKDEYGDYLHYTLVNSIADVDSTENSYYTSDHDVYIHSSTAPSKIFVLVSGINLHATLSNGETIYIEGCEFIGGNYGGVRVTNGGTVRPRVLLKNCGFTDAGLGNSLYLQGCSSIIQNCYASHGSADGFNYHSVGLCTPEAIEINCIGRNNGTIGNNTNNGSTSHETAKIIRLNCEYFGNIGPNVADVDTGTLSFNYGVVSHDSNGSSSNKSGFQCQSGIMWNDTCSAYNNDYNFQSYLGGELRQHNCSGSVNLTGNGKATAY